MAVGRLKVVMNCLETYSVCSRVEWVKGRSKMIRQGLYVSTVWD